MNVFSSDISKPTADIIGRDDKPELLGEENMALLNSQDNSAEFAVALADLVKPEAAPSHKSSLANKPAGRGLPSEHIALVPDDDKLVSSPNIGAQQEGNSSFFVVDAKSDAKVAAATQLTPNIINSAQEVRQEKNKLIPFNPHADVSTIKTSLTKNVQPVLAIIPKPKAGQNQISSAVFVDIAGTQDKIIPNKTSIEVPFTLQPKQQNSNVRSTLLPVHNFAETKEKHAAVTLHEIQPGPIGAANVRLQAPVYTQPHMQTSTNIQTVITQIREPMTEHLNAAYDASQNRSIDKPKDIVVQLSPAELGRVQIRFSFDVGERVVAQIASENHETMAALRQKSGLLLAQLKLGGFENIDLSFDTSGQKNFSGQNSNSGFPNNQNGQAETNFWQSTKTDLERDPPKSGEDDNVYPLRTHMHAQSAQIDIIL